jgi:outer membrane protein TolC
MGSNKKLLLHYISFLLNQKIDEITIPTDDKAITTADEVSVMNNNTDVKKASHGLAVRSSMVDVAVSSLLPTLGVFGEASSANDTLMRNMNAHAAYTVGAKLSWNLFNGGVDAHNFEKARIDRLKTATEVEMAKKGIALQYDKLHTEIDNLDEQIVSLEKERALAAEITKNYEGRYNEHLVSMSDLIIKQSTEIEKIMTLQSVKNQRNERIFALEKLNYGANQ